MQEFQEFENKVNELLSTAYDESIQKDDSAEEKINFVSNILLPSVLTDSNYVAQIEALNIFTYNHLLTHSEHFIKTFNESNIIPAVIANILFHLNTTQFDLIDNKELVSIVFSIVKTLLPSLLPQGESNV